MKIWAKSNTIAQQSWYCMEAFQLISEQLASLSTDFTKFETADVKLLFGLLTKNNSKISLVRRRRILVGAKYVKNIQEQF